MRILLEKAGDNSEQRLTAEMDRPAGDAFDALSIGDVFHVTGQPADVTWRITDIIRPRTECDHVRLKDAVLCPKCWRLLR